MTSYAVPPFTASITTRRSTAIYNMHTYWAKKPHEAVRRYVRHYTGPGDVVLDPFCGSGGTALAAAMEGRRAVALDRSPAAVFIARNQCRTVDPEALRRAGATVRAAVEREVGGLYATRCERCGGAATTVYTVLAKRGKRMEADVARVGVECAAGCRPARRERAPIDEDLARLAAIDGAELPHWFPDAKMMHVEEGPWGAEWREGRDFRRVDELYTRRNLWALAALRAAISGWPDELRAPLLFCFTSILFKASRLMAHNSDGVGRVQKGTYYVPARGHDVNVLRFWDGAVADMARGYAAIGRVEPPAISLGSATALALADESVDYVFTDPPYAGKVQFGELNFVWEVWLGLDTRWHDDEIIVNAVRGKSEADWGEAMRGAMRECARVLKPGRALSLCYHDDAGGTWAELGAILASSGLEPEPVDGAVTIDAPTKTTNQYFSDKVGRRDLVLTFRKSGRRWGARGEGFASRAKRIVSGFLRANPGATRDRVFDDLVSRLMRAGAMERHDFDALLEEVAEAREVDARGARRWWAR